MLLDLDPLLGPNQDLNLDLDAHLDLRLDVV